MLSVHEGVGDVSCLNHLIDFCQDFSSSVCDVVDVSRTALLVVLVIIVEGIVSVAWADQQLNSRQSCL